jgi:hypothetical protein
MNKYETSSLIDKPGGAEGQYPQAEVAKAITEHSTKKTINKKTFSRQFS